MHGAQTRAQAVPLGVGDTFADHRIEGLLGQGGMGVVYRATDMRLNRAVALKVIKPELSLDEDFRRRFRRESELAASIRHPNVVTIYQAGESDGLLFVTMDLIDGTDLRALLTQRGAIDPGTASAMAAHIAAALDAAHARGLVHRDVKPANILLTNGQPQHLYLTDFGLTKRTSSQSGLTKAGLFVGTLDYAAPEQIKGWPVDARTDVYALGCVLFEMLAGQPPFRRDNDMAVMYAHMTEAPPTLSSVGPALDAVVQRALAKEPDHRYPSAGDLGRAAVAAATGQIAAEPERTVATGRAAPGAPLPPEITTATPTVAEAPAPPPPPAPPSHVTSVLPQRRSPWPAVLAVLAVLAVAGAGAAVLLTRGHDSGTKGASANNQPPPRQGPPSQQPNATRTAVQRIGDLADLSAEGRATTVAGDFQAAAANRRDVIRRLGALTVPPELQPSVFLFTRAMDASFKADLAHQRCGNCAEAALQDARASSFKRRFVRAFNPFAQRFIGRSFSPDDI